MDLEPRYEMRAPANSEEWQKYHAIRRKELFENRGLFGVYDENHPDLFVRDNHPLVFLSGSEIVGTIRVDIQGDRAVFRQVAVRGDVQRAGHGRAMISSAVLFARSRGCKTIQVTSANDAVGFYRQCGFEPESAAPQADAGVLMKRNLPGSMGEP